MKPAAPMLASALFGTALGCSAARPPHAHVREPAASEPPGTSYVSPARWDYHPSAPLTPLGALQLPDGGCVFTAEGGQRWTAAKTRTVGSRIVCSGVAEASFSVAPEDLTAVARRASGSWLFVGEGGTLYEANEPLGAFVRTVPAPEPFAKVTGAGLAVLAATQDGRLMRWEAATGWAAVPPSPALAGAHVFDLVAAPSAPRVLALGFPEALFGSEDEGATWRAVAAPPVGARRLGSTSAGDIGAQGISESIVWRDASFTRGSERLLVPAASLAVEVGRAPSVSAIQQGHAALDGDRYYEVVHPENDGEPWLLARGRLEGRLETTPLADSGRCGNMRLGARGRFVVLACASVDNGEITSEVRRSADGGSTWAEPLRLTAPDLDQTGIAVGPDGTALVTGVCRASEASGNCKPTAPLLLRQADGSAHLASVSDAAAVDAGASGRDALRVTATSAAQLAGVAQSPVFGADGRSAYFLGKRGKDDRIGIFVSHDGGMTFSARSLQPTVVAHPPRRIDDDEGASDNEGPETLELDENASLKPGDDGTLGLVALRSHGAYVYVTTDDDGRVREVAGPPLDDESAPIDVFFAGYGQRVLALPSYLLGDATSGTYYESLDGGVNWDKQTMPQALVREYSRNNMAAVCASAGCLLGETLARVGWGGGSDAGSASPPTEATQDRERRVLTPIVCELSPSTGWSRIENVVVPEGASSPLPAATELMRGRSLWSALTHDRATGKVAIVSASLPDRLDGEARVIRRPLLGARGNNTATALVAHQPDGYAALRAPYATDAQGHVALRVPLRNLEIAWENLVEGTVGKAHVADAGLVEAADVSVTAGVGSLHPAMVALRPRGLFVRVHPSHQKTPGEEIFVDPKGRVERYAAAPLPTQSPLGPLDPRPDATTSAGELLDVGLLLDDSRAATTVLVAKRSAAGAWSYAAESLLPSRAGGPLATFTTWSSTPKATGMMALVAEPTHARAWAHFLGFRPDGGFLPAEPLPTLNDLGARPRPCTTAERAGGPRVALPLKAHGTILFPGARHPVLVFEPRTRNGPAVGEPLVLLTSGAVVHGTPASPCLAAFQAESAHRALVSAAIPGDVARSWLFRAVYDAPLPRGRRADPNATHVLEYRPMTCRYDPAAAIPEIVWSQEGTSRP
jgi:hypothetical protein